MSILGTRCPAVLPSCRYEETGTLHEVVLNTMPNNKTTSHWNLPAK